MIYVDNVSKVYGKDFLVLENINLTITQGEFVSIVGHSGAGKTTLLKLLLAEEKPTTGNVYFESFNIHKLRDKDLTEYRRKVGVVFQDFRLLPDKTAYENIATPPTCDPMSFPKIKKYSPVVISGGRSVCAQIRTIRTNSLRIIVA